MLQEMKRDAAMCGEEMEGVDSGKHNSTLLSSQLRFGEDPPSDSSDEDMSTFQSPVCVFDSPINCQKCDFQFHLIMSPWHKCHFSI